MLVFWNLHQEPFHLDSLQPTSTLVRRGPGHHRFYQKIVLLATNHFLCNHTLCCKAGSHQAAEEAFLHKIFLWVTFVLQDLKRWHMAKPFRWRLPSYSGYWLPERGESKNFTGHVPLRYLKVMKLDNRGEGVELHWHMKRMFSDFPHQKVYPYSCWYAGLETSLLSTWTLFNDNELKADRKVKVLKFIQILGDPCNLLGSWVARTSVILITT